MNAPQVILASSSPRRAELLRQVTVSFTVVPSQAPEVHEEQLTARETCQLNAYRKARTVAKQFPDALVIGADTLVSLGTTLFGKPANLDEAQRMLQTLSGRTHEVVTAVCLLNLRRHRQRHFFDKTAVTFRPLDTAQIQRYCRRVNPFDKAGGYAIQEDGDLLVEKISGSYTNVVGLPVEKLREELRAWEI